MSRIVIFVILLFLQLSASSQSRLKKIEILSSIQNEFGLMTDSINGLVIFSKENESGLPTIWESILKDGSMTKPKQSNFPLERKWFGTIGHLNRENGICYFMGLTEDLNGIISNGIFKLRRENDRWVNPEQQQIAYYLNKSKDQSFCISEDQNTMILSIQHYFSHGVEDLYVCFKQKENTWSEPKNLGPIINTKYEEFTPFLDKDNRTLYFSSNGHLNGYGSKDIWVSYRLDESWQNWTEPKNLGNQVNTSGMETHFFKNSPNSKIFYITSTRTSNGQADLYTVDLDEEYQLPHFELQKMDSNPIIKQSDSSYSATDSVNILEICIVNKSNDKKINGLAGIQLSDTAYSIRVNSDSIYKLFIPWNDTVKITASSDNYMPTTRQIFFKNERINLKLIETISLDSLEKGKSIILQNVLFERGKPILLAGSNQSLELIAQLMIDNPAYKIEIAGHTDNSGNAYLNHKLSEERAKAVKTWLLSRDISGERIDTIGFGGEKPIASNQDESTMKLNRRVEFRIIE